MTGKNTLDTAIVKRMVEAQAIRTASIIGQPGGWSILLKIGMTEKPLGAQRTDKPRLWKSLDRCVDYMKSELHIARFDMLDATQHSDIPMVGSDKNNAAERMREAHQAAAYTKWLKAQIQEAIDDPRPPVPHEEVMRNVRAKIASMKAEKIGA